MSNNRQESRDKLRQAGCEVTIPQAIVPVIPVLPTVPCDPASPDPLPNTFATPSGQIPAPGIIATLDLIEIGNDAQSRSCVDVTGKEDAVPDLKTIAADSITLDFSWYAVSPALSDGQLIYIADLYNDLTQLKSLLLSNANNAADILASYTHLSTQQAESACALAQSLKSAANAQAVELALLQLVCGWYNQEQIINCPAGALATDEVADLDALNPSVIPAGTVFSVESLGAANTEAYDLAAANLRCVYGNDEQTQTCEDVFPEEPPVDSLPEESSITIPVNSFFSSNSKEEANVLASEEAASLLNCFWNNELQEIACAVDPDSVAAIVAGTLIYNPNTNQISEEYTNGAFPQGSVTDSISGNTVIVAADLFTSTTSFEDAQALAQAAGEGLLLCRWGNDVTKAQCPIVVIEDPNKKGLLDPLQSPPAPYTLDVLPNLELSKPLFVSNKFFEAKSLDLQQVSLGEKTFNITPVDPAVTLQFRVNDLVSIKPLSVTDEIINGINLVGKITEYLTSSITINVLQKIGEPLLVLNSSNWSNWLITLNQGSVVVENSVLSDISKDNANTTAQDLVDSSLRCIYCNVQIDPRCLPLQLTKNYDGELVEYDPANIPATTSATVWDLVPWSLVDGERVKTQLNLVWKVDGEGVPLVDAYGFKIPVYNGNTVIDPGLIKDPQFSWSDDATLGVAAGKFCGESVQVVTEIADNQLPVAFYREVEDACIYCNDPVGADCVNSAVVTREDPLNGSLFLPARTVCVSSAPQNYQEKKYLITDSVLVPNTVTLTGSFTTLTPSLVFSFTSSSLNLAGLGVVVGDYLDIASTSTKIRFVITAISNSPSRVTVTNPYNNEIPSGVVTISISKPLKGNFSLVGGDIVLTVSNSLFSLDAYTFQLNKDYVRVLGAPTKDFIINGKTSPNIFNVLNPEGYALPVGEQLIQLWKADTTNQTLAQQYATDTALELASSLLNCEVLRINCSRAVTVTCADKNKGNPDANLFKDLDAHKITLPSCFLSGFDQSSDDLTAQARQIALTTLVHCLFFNDPLTLPCTGGALPDGYGKWLNSTSGEVPKKTLLGPDFGSVKADAEMLVEAITNSGGCIFTNEQQEVTCDSPEVSTGCPPINRAFPTSIQIPEGTFIHVVNDRTWAGRTETPDLPNLNQQARDLGASIITNLCEFCGNSFIPKGGEGEGCPDPKQILADFNRAVAANTFYSVNQGAANAIAQQFAETFKQCLTFNEDDPTVSTKICEAKGEIEGALNGELNNVDALRVSVQSHLNTIIASLGELYGYVGGFYVECVDDAPELKMPGSYTAPTAITLTPTINNIKIACKGGASGASGAT